MQETQFANIMEGLSKIYGSRHITTNLMTMWWEVFNDYDYDHFLDAVTSHIVSPAKASFFPNTGDLLVFLDNPAEAKIDAIRAWDYLNQCIMSEISCNNPLCVHLYHTLNLQDCTHESRDYKRREFVEMYQDYRRCHDNDHFLETDQTWVLTELNKSDQAFQEKIAYSIETKYNKKPSIH